MPYSSYESFKKYQVPSDSIEDFLNRYYKPDRFTGRGAEYAAVLIASHKNYVENYGFDFITHHDSKNGEIVSYYPNNGKENNHDTS